MPMAKGFRAAAVCAGLKKNGKKDLALIVSDTPAAAAGVFTKNRVQAAPVRLDKQRLSSGVGRAIIVNSGNANCCTGDQGMADARAMTRLAADGLKADEAHVLTASTGVIGQHLDMDKIRAAVPGLVSGLSEDGFAAAAEAIMTTDTRPKLVFEQGQMGEKTYSLAAMAKGSGMIRPDMATMLCFVCTDLEIPAADLQRALVSANEASFNRITIDGDTSTNDTVLVLANGQSGARAKTHSNFRAFSALLENVLGKLARMVVEDGEGATKCVEISVINAETREDARQMADTVANSSLVKTAFFGEDANWGRILAALGRAGVEFDPDAVDIWFDDVKMVNQGLGCGAQAEAVATAVLQKKTFVVTIDVKSGRQRASVLTCDFSVDYVKINADYRS
ncbi:MAG: bifunctional glutamate N-acetyltransferase/amino-acid acetyltransferase ArgJ [Desulfosalsimonas sp.]|uniref:bifunctional glutamate N-acetyltransferase/amino-acid acetyltransferase ArgJ n=1 Tax=Desulfosalsimonas sp. TaxID=3073848 RepID=UPI003970D969